MTKTKAQLLEINQKWEREVVEQRARVESADVTFRVLKSELKDLKESHEKVLLEKDQHIIFLRRVVEELLWILKKVPK